jgi:hypothetical protein
MHEVRGRKTLARIGEELFEILIAVSEVALMDSEELTDDRWFFTRDI